MEYPELETEINVENIANTNSITFLPKRLEKNVLRNNFLRNNDVFIVNKVNNKVTFSERAVPTFQNFWIAENRGKWIVVLESRVGGYKLGKSGSFSNAYFVEAMNSQFASKLADSTENGYMVRLVEIEDGVTSDNSNNNCRAFKLEFLKEEKITVRKKN